MLKWIVLFVLFVFFAPLDGGAVFGVGSAQARVGRPMTPMSYAGMARRSARRDWRYHHHHYYPY